MTGPVRLIPLLLLLLGAAQPLLAASSGSKPRIIRTSDTVMYGRQGSTVHLHCSFTGQPRPRLTWYRADTGRPVVTRNTDPVSNQVVLSNDLLITGLSRVNEGRYYCNASNIHGWAVSHNITLSLAYLHRKFQHSPQNKRARVDETVQMECRPPNGLPPPKVSWTKDGKPIEPDNPDDPWHYIILDNGNLRISRARLSDKGRYRCVARNIDGERRSKPATLEVRRKPRFLRQPQDKHVSVNDDVRFYCVVAGDPPPVIIWRREDGSRLVSSRRTKILPDKSLLIERVQLADEGKYVCNASNSAGRLEAVAKLSVSSPPSFYRTPEDKAVAIGQRVTFFCEVAGRPKPYVYWETSDKRLFFAGKSPPSRASHIQVFEDGRLVIHSVRKSDAGRYVCHANSYAKQIRSSAMLTVEDRELNPPPIIDYGPQNQTLLEGSTAVLRCIVGARGPPAAVSWYKGRLKMVFDFKDHRIIKLRNGVLQIADVTVRDSANYTCEAALGPFATRWTASLRVLRKTDPISAQQQLVVRAPEDAGLFPKRPAHLRVTDIGDTWAALSWEVGKSSTYLGSAPVLSYQLERFSPADKLGWVVLEPNCKDMKYKVRNLKPQTEYFFLVRASNIHGLGRPLRLRHAIRTRSKRNLLPGIFTEKPSIIESVKVTNLDLRVTGHDTMKVMWNVKGPDEPLRAVSGFVVRYKPVMLTRCLVATEQISYTYTYCSLKGPLFSQLSTELSQNGYSFYKETRELRQTVEEHVSKQTSRVATIIKDLRPFHCYEVDVEPFFRDQDYGRIAGRVSHSRNALTYDSVPSQPPTSIAAKWVTNTTVELRWGPPPVSARNGVITGYNVHVIGNETRFNKFLATNSSVYAATLAGMNPRVAYTIHLAARTCKGEGIRSMALKLSPVPAAAGNHFLREPWFIGTMAGCGLLWAVLCVITVIVCKRYCQQKRLPYKPVHPAYSNGTLKERGAGGGLSLRPLGPEGGMEGAMPPPDLTNMLQDKGHRELGLDEPGLPPVAPVISPVSPYATTSLITNQAFGPPPYPNSDSTSAGKASSSTCPYMPQAAQYSDGLGCRSCSDCGSHATTEELEAIMANSAGAGQTAVRVHPSAQQQQAQQQQRPAGWASAATTPPRHKVLNIGEIIPPPPEYPPPPPGANNAATTPGSQHSVDQPQQPQQQRGYREGTKSPVDQRKAGSEQPVGPGQGVTSPALSGRVSSSGGRSSSVSGSGATSSSNLYHQLLPPSEQARLQREHHEEEEDGDYSDLSDRCDSPDFHSSLLGEASETCPSALASAYSDSVGSEEPDMSSVVSSVASEDEAFLGPGERDFATSVQMAAEAHHRRGRPHHQQQQPARGHRRHHHHAPRAASPGYSTDSTNYGVLPPPKKAYPKAQRRRQQQQAAAKAAEPRREGSQQPQQPQQPPPPPHPAYAFGNHPVA